MDIPNDVRQAVRELASHPADSAGYAAALAPLVEKWKSSSQITSIVTTLEQKALQCLNQTPREAVALASMSYELAKIGNDAQVKAKAALTCAIAFNILGEFRDALSHSREAAALFESCADMEHLARSLVEAAWANTYIGQLKDAAADLQKARENSSSVPLQARCDWIQAILQRDQGQFDEAISLLGQARDAFQSAQLPIEAARCERELVHTYLLIEREPPFSLEKVQKIFEIANCALDVLLCNYLVGLSMLHANHYSQSLDIFLKTRQDIIEFGAFYFVTWCNIGLGLAYWHLNQMYRSIEANQYARDYFLAHGINRDISACDINLGNAYYALNRYDEALIIYQEAAKLAQAEGRIVRVAHIHSNMALAFAKQGFFSKSLDLHQRALQIFVSQDSSTLAAICHVNLAATFRQLGQYIEALNHLQQASKVFTEKHLAGYLAECNIDLGDVYLSCGEITQAATSLEQARQVCVENGFDPFIPVCDHLLAKVALARGENDSASELIGKSRTAFLSHVQTVDAALIDLTEGGLHLQSDRIAQAANCFQRARDILWHGFPDQAWRADCGLGKCQMALGNKPDALKHMLAAVRTIAQSRSILVTEQLSNDYFAGRQSVYDDALDLAVELDARESALEVIEASKARILLTLLANREWRPPQVTSDPHIADLITREKSLRYQIETLRRQTTVQAEKAIDEPLRGSEELATISGAALQELNALNQAYESVLTQLRLATTGLAGVSAPAPFDLERFRKTLKTTFRSDWVALDYALSGDKLTIAVVDSKRVRLVRKKLTNVHRSIIDKCTSAESEMRELIYRGAQYDGYLPVPAASYLQRLYEILIPPGLDAKTLVISPHRSLHALPFHALMDGDAYLIERHALVYAPSLQVMQHLINPLNGKAISTPLTPLVLGVSDFAGRMRPLPNAADEVENLRRAFAGRGEYLQNTMATRQGLLQLQTSGDLQKFAMLHFATHAVLDQAAPYQSRILLSDEPLTTADILDLQLNARLVTLSACQTALAEGGQGDELMGLARAFFYAGAHGLLATLWHVEDASTAKLVERFYHHWIEGKNISKALRQAQIEMIRAGHSPFQWAPFVFMGCP